MAAKDRRYRRPRRCLGRLGGFCCQLPPASTFGLSEAELWREAERLVAAGWGLDEIRAVLAIPELTQ